MMFAPAKSKFYPLVIFAILLVLTQFSLFQLLAGLVVGYMHAYHLLDKLCNFSLDTASSCERNCLFSTFSSLPNFVTASASEDYAAACGEHLQKFIRSSAHSGNSGANFAPPPTTSERSFGGSGVQIGGAGSGRPVSRLVQGSRDGEGSTASQQSENNGVSERHDEKAKLGTDEDLQLIEGRPESEHGEAK